MIYQRRVSSPGTDLGSERLQPTLKKAHREEAYRLLNPITPLSGAHRGHDPSGDAVKILYGKGCLAFKREKKRKISQRRYIAAHETRRRLTGAKDSPGIRLGLTRGAPGGEAPQRVPLSLCPQGRACVLYP